LSYPADALTDDIDSLITGTHALSAAADSIATIQSGNAVLASNFDHVEEVLDNLQAFLSELKTGHYYCPVGSLMPFAGTDAYVPTGWILCWGQSYAASSASADLQTVLNAAGFSAIPDLRGRVIAGIDNMGGTDAARLSLANNVGTAGGLETLPEHTHSISGSGTTSSSDWNAVYNHYSPGSGSSAYPVSTSEGGGRTVQGAGGGHTHTWSFSGTSGATGTGTHGVVQPTMVLNYLIKN
jgi:microcystin-dependent protein